MSMKPGATTLPRSVDGACAPLIAEIADGSNLSVANSEVARVPRRARAIDDAALVMTSRRFALTPWIREERLRRA